MKWVLPIRPRGSPFLGGRAADIRRSLLPTRLTACLACLRTLDAVTPIRERLNAFPRALATSSALWLYTAFMNTHEENKKVQRGVGGVVAEERAPSVEESHYSVIDCTCQGVSALFILPKHQPRPLSPFPYLSEIYHVKAPATRGTAVRALGCC